VIKSEGAYESMSRRKISIALAAVMLILAAAACQMSGQTVLPGVPTLEALITQQPGLPSANQGTGLTADESALETLFQQVSPGVVALKVTTETGGGLGSGFVFDADGHIVTNYHVVDGADQVEVDFPSGFKVFGDVVGKDPDSDLAVIAVDAPADELHPLTLGDSDLLQVGQVVAAIGNPFGLYSTMTTGIVSALGRTSESLRPQDPNNPTVGRYSMGALIQTDAAINPGNSGGPLFNLDGQVVGLNRAIETTSVNASGEPLNSGVGFSIGSNVLARIVPELIKNGTYVYPYLGISFMDDLPLDLIQQLDLKANTGAYVATVVPGGPGDEAGLQAGTESLNIDGLDLKKGGDLVIAVDGKPIKTFDELIGYMITHKSPGDVMTLTILRGEQQMDVDVTLGERPAQ
jgi:S1-C subfamily serine protease